MRVCHVITGLRAGGAELFLLRLIPRLADKGIASSVVSLGGGSDLLAEFQAAGIKVGDLGLRPGPGALLGVPRLARHITRSGPHIVQTWLHHADLLGTLACRWAGHPTFVWTLRCSDMFAHDERLSTRLLARALVWLSRLPSAVVANSWAGKGFHEDAGYRPRHWIVIPNGIDTGAFRPNAEARRELRSRWKVGAQGRVICHAARSHPMKGQHVFLEAVRPVLERHGETHVVMAGGAVGTRPDWPADLAGRLHVLGRRGDMAAVYAASDLFCLSSIFGEGFPNVVAEAMACGLPCVGTDVGDTARIVGDTGLTVPPGDPDALGRALAELVAAPHDHLATLGAAARARIVSEFDLEKVASAYVDFYGSLVKQG